MNGRLVAESEDTHRRTWVRDEPEDLTASPPAEEYPGSGFLEAGTFMLATNYPIVMGDIEVVTPYRNGNLHYLYDRSKKPVRRYCRVDRRHPLRQPCWRAGRWKSLT